MKKAVISSGSKQYLVAEGDSLEIELVDEKAKQLTFQPLLVIDDKKVNVGIPEVAGVSVVAEVKESNVAGNKVTAIRYKAKKRVHKVHGHRQHHTRIVIKSIV